MRPRPRPGRPCRAASEDVRDGLRLEPRWELPVESRLEARPRRREVPDTEQRKAAWEMYVELVTRISVQPVGPGEGLLREALNSLHEIFDETRRILKAHGPGVATRLDGSESSFGEIAIAVLNQHLRPFLSKWHPFLQAHEAPRGPTTPPLAHEVIWPEVTQLRQELDELRGPLTKYADLLAVACGISTSLTSPAARDGIQRRS